MKQYAFIDLQNTQTTAEKMLGFSVDVVRLADFLYVAHRCERVYSRYSSKLRSLVSKNAHTLFIPLDTWRHKIEWMKGGIFQTNENAAKRDVFEGEDNFA
jgi:hypothetical protein